MQEILAQLVAGGRSGTLVINSSCNHVITIALDEGHILALFYGPKRGRAAIPLIQAVTGGTFRFQETLFSLNPQDLPLLRPDAEYTWYKPQPASDISECSVLFPLQPFRRLVGAHLRAPSGFDPRTWRVSIHRRGSIYRY